MADFIAGIGLFRNAMQYSQLWFSEIMDRAGAMPYLLVAIFTILVFRFFLSPLVGGSGGSDKAKKSGKKDK